MPYAAIQPRVKLSKIMQRSWRILLKIKSRKNYAEKPNILDGPEPTVYQPVKLFIIDNYTDCRFFLRGWRWTSTFLPPTSNKHATWNKFLSRKILDSHINRMNWGKSSLHGTAKRKRLIRPKARKANDFT